MTLRVNHHRGAKIMSAQNGSGAKFNAWKSCSRDIPLPRRNVAVRGGRGGFGRFGAASQVDAHLTKLLVSTLEQDVGPEGAEVANATDQITLQLLRHLAVVAVGGPEWLFDDVVDDAQ